MEKTVEKKPKSFLKERILRFKPVSIIRKNLSFFIFIFLILLSFLFGLWNIKRYEVHDLDGNYIDEEISSQIQGYVEEEIIGKNYFLFSPSQVSKEMYLNISKLETVKIEKIVPDKIVIFVQVYDKKFVAKLRDSSCKVLSMEGVVLSDICNEEEEGCCKQYAREKELIVFSSPDVEPTTLDGEKSRLLVMEEIKRVVQIVEIFKYQIREVTLFNEILEIIDTQERLFRFTISQDIDIQLRRLIVVLGKVNPEHMDFSFLDVRFERPVMLK